MPEVLSCYPFGSEHHVVFKDSNQSTDDVWKKLAAKGYVNLGVQKIEPGIEDCFIDLMRSR
jgi:hypothetical protein